MPEEALPPEHGHLIAFEVAGDCMNGDRIFDGDVVIVDPELMPAGGDIAVFGMTDEGGRLSVTLKRLSRSEGTLRLVPSNPAHAPIVILTRMTCWSSGRWSRRCTGLPEAPRRSRVTAGCHRCGRGGPPGDGCHQARGHLARLCLPAGRGEHVMRTRRPDNA
jgi:hypothetical protein